MSLAPPMLVGMTGQRRTGKDTAGTHLKTRFGYVTTAFGDAIRAEAAAHYEVPRHWFAVDRVKDQPFREVDAKLAARVSVAHGLPEDFSLRDLLLEVDARRRAEDPDYWIKRTLEFVRRTCATGARVVVTDVRMPAEAEALRAAGGVLVQVRRVAGPGGEPQIDAARADSDPTERNVRAISPDHVVHNPEGDIDTYLERLIEALRPPAQRPMRESRLAAGGRLA